MEAKGFKPGDRVTVSVIYESDREAGVHCGLCGTVVRCDGNDVIVDFGIVKPTGTYAESGGYRMGKLQLDLIEVAQPTPEPAKPEPSPISEDDVFSIWRVIAFTFDVDMQAARDLRRVEQRIREHLPVDSVLHLPPAATNPPQEPRA